MKEISKQMKVPAMMQQCIINYKDLTFEAIKEGKNFPTNDQPNPSMIDVSLRLFATSLLGSLIVFGNHTFYIISCYVFMHNHLAIDDCGYVMNAQDYHTEPTAKIKMKSYMGKNNYYELALLHGFYEVLVVGCRKSEKVFVNMGSSSSSKCS